MVGEGDSGPYTQAVGLIKSLRSTVNSVQVSTPVGIKCHCRLSAATFRKFFSRRHSCHCQTLYCRLKSKSPFQHFTKTNVTNTKMCLQSYGSGRRNCGKWDEWKTEAMARQRNRNALDNGMDELTSAF